MVHMVVIIVVNLCKFSGFLWCKLWFSMIYPGWWFGTVLFFHILGITIPTDFHIFQMGSNHQPVSYVLLSFYTVFKKRVSMKMTRH